MFRWHKKILEVHTQLFSHQKENRHSCRTWRWRAKFQTRTDGEERSRYISAHVDIFFSVTRILRTLPSKRACVDSRLFVRHVEKIQITRSPNQIQNVNVIGRVGDASTFFPRHSTSHIFPHHPHTHSPLSKLSCAENKQGTNDKSPWMSFLYCMQEEEKNMTNRKSDNRENGLFTEPCLLARRRNLAWDRALCNHRQNKEQRSRIQTTHTRTEK